MMEETRILFMGTPDFAVPSLRALSREGYEIVGVVTQPDRPKGRGQKLCASSVKQEALALGLDIFQPTKIKDEQFIKMISELNPQFIIVVAFGQILPKDVLDLPQYGCINVHASLLPKYRGAAPIHRVIINGEQETGVTTMLMDKGLDTGDILLKEKVLIPLDMNCGELHDLLAQKGATLLVQTVEDLLNNRIQAVEQDVAVASYAAMLERGDELINWHDTAITIHNQIRGLDPWPGSYTTYENKQLKIRAAKLWETKTKPEKPGTVLEIVKGEGFVVQTGEGGILVTKVQPFGKRIIPADSFMNGYNIKKGYVFSDV